MKNKKWEKLQKLYWDDELLKVKLLNDEKLLTYNVVYSRDNRIKFMTNFDKGLFINDVMWLNLW